MTDPEVRRIVLEEWDIWVSIKFTGSRFVSGSKEANRVLFDRVLLVQDPNPMRHYKPVAPKKNLIKNSGFEQGTGAMIGVILNLLFQRKI